MGIKGRDIEEKRREEGKTDRENKEQEYTNKIK